MPIGHVQTHTYGEKIRSETRHFLHTRQAAASPIGEPRGRTKAAGNVRTRMLGKGAYR